MDMLVLCIISHKLRLIFLQQHFRHINRSKIPKQMNSVYDVAYPKG